MRADRLVSLVLLLRQRGRLSADTLARELEVSTRTVLRDIEALSTAGVPVYAARGRHGGFALLPGFRTELTGLSPDEALALLTARSAQLSGSGPAAVSGQLSGSGPAAVSGQFSGSGPAAVSGQLSGSGPAAVSGQLFGLGPALVSAMRKVADAVPGDATEAARRLLVDPETDLLVSRRPTDEVPAPAMTEVRSAVLSGRRLRIHYAATGQDPRWRTVDPIGLVTVRDRSYLLATRSGADRTYRLSRITAAETLPEPAHRPADVDLDQLWRDRCARFLSEDHIIAAVRVNPTRRDDVLTTAAAVRCESPEPDGRLRLEVTYQDLRHAVWALWRLGTDAEALSPPSLRAALRERATAVAAYYT